MSESTTLGELYWWDLDEIADNDASIFGPTAWTLNYYWAVMAQRGTAMFAARTPATVDALAGWVVLSAGGGEADVMTIATTEAARGMGIGRILLKTGINWAQDQGAEVIHLEVDERNTSALGLYSSFGFEEWGRRSDYYQGADALLMRHRLQA